MVNIVISPSQQCGKAQDGHSEQSIMFPIGQVVFAKLKSDARINPYMIPKLTGTDNENLIKAVDLSNQFIKANGGDGYHLALHADAGYAGTGASGFYYNDKSKLWGRPIWERICALTPWRDMAFYSRPGLYELKNTRASAFLLEVSFYDKPDEEKWMENTVDTIASTIVQGIYDGLNLAPPVHPMTVTEALKFLHDRAGIDSAYWLQQSQQVKWLDACFIKIASAWKG